MDSLPQKKSEIETESNLDKGDFITPSKEVQFYTEPVPMNVDDEQSSLADLNKDISEINTSLSLSRTLDKEKNVVEVQQVTEYGYPSFPFKSKLITVTDDIGKIRDPHTWVFDIRGQETILWTSPRKKDGSDIKALAPCFLYLYDNIHHVSPNVVSEDDTRLFIKHDVFNKPLEIGLYFGRRYLTDKIQHKVGREKQFSYHKLDYHPPVWEFA